MVSGYCASVSSSTLLIYSFTPLESDRISAMPIMPMLPASATIKVRPFLVIRLFRDRCSAVPKCMEVAPVRAGGCAISSCPSKGMVSSVTRPSSKRMVRVAYCAASSGLCVTMMTNRSLAISLSTSIICTLVSLSSAPVGSSASKISGSFTSARAMATRCIWPPLISLGFLFN